MGRALGMPSPRSAWKRNCAPAWTPWAMHCPTCSSARTMRRSATAAWAGWRPAFSMRLPSRGCLPSATACATATAPSRRSSRAGSTVGAARRLDTADSSCLGACARQDLRFPSWLSAASVEASMVLGCAALAAGRAASRPRLTTSSCRPTTASGSPRCASGRPPPPTRSPSSCLLRAVSYARARRVIRCCADALNWVLYPGRLHGGRPRAAPEAGGLPRQRVAAGFGGAPPSREFGTPGHDLGKTQRHPPQRHPSGARARRADASAAG